MRISKVKSSGKSMYLADIVKYIEYLEEGEDTPWSEALSKEVSHLTEIDRKNITKIIKKFGGEALTNAHYYKNNAPETINLNTKL